MPNQAAGHPRPPSLRQRAEAAAAAGKNVDVAALTPEQVRGLVHELQVHQIELEMQNEELRQAQLELEASRARYFDLYDVAPVGYVTLSDKGLIQEANLSAAALLRVGRAALVRAPLTRWIAADDQDVFYLHCRRLRETRQPQVCEVRMVRQDGTSFWANLEAAPADARDAGTPGLRVIISDITERRQLLEQARGLMARLADAQETERRALAHELHDSLGQNLSALGVTLTLARNLLAEGQPALMGPRLDDALKLVEALTAHTRDLMFELQPPTLEDFGLFAALRWFVAQFARRTDLAIEVEGRDLSPRPAIAVEIALFRIAQEALTNASKHAPGSRVTVRLDRTSDQICLLIADDGWGFDPDAPRHQASWGLMTMRERAEAIGGQFTLATTPGRGTQVQVLLNEV